MTSTTTTTTVGEEHSLLKNANVETRKEALRAVYEVLMSPKFWLIVTCLLIGALTIIGILVAWDSAALVEYKYQIFQVPVIVFNTLVVLMILNAGLIKMFQKSDKDNLSSAVLKVAIFILFFTYIGLSVVPQIWYVSRSIYNLIQCPVATGNTLLYSVASWGFVPFAPICQGTTDLTRFWITSVISWICLLLDIPAIILFIFFYLKLIDFQNSELSLYIAKTFKKQHAEGMLSTKESIGAFIDSAYDLCNARNVHPEHIFSTDAAIVAKLERSIGTTILPTVDNNIGNHPNDYDEGDDVDQQIGGSLIHRGTMRKKGYTTNIRQ